MAHATLEDAAPVPAMVVREEFKVVDRRHMEDCGDRLFLLALIRDACRHRLESGDVRPAEFEVGGRLPINDDDRQPGSIWSLLVLRHSERCLCSA